MKGKTLGSFGWRLFGVGLAISACSGDAGTADAPATAGGAGGSGGTSGSSAGTAPNSAGSATTGGGMAGEQSGSEDPEAAGAAGAAGGEGVATDNPYGACDGQDRTSNSCPIAGSICIDLLGCEPPLVNGKCPAAPSGSTATPVGDGPCVLNCLPPTEGDPAAVCPSGMVCGMSGFCVTHHPTPYGYCREQSTLKPSLCPIPGSACEQTWGCAPPCPNGVSDCPAPPADGNPSVQCNEQKCRLSCAAGESCPAGTYCSGEACITSAP